jgi:hypothetical protein
VCTGGDGGTNEVLTPTAFGQVSDSVTGIVGTWYAYGDMYGLNGEPPGNCQSLGMFMPSQCSSVTSPPPSMLADGGYQGFAPSATGAMCLSGVGAKVLACNPGVTGCSGSDYGDIWGIGIGLSLNEQSDSATQMPYDTTANHVTGFAFEAYAALVTGDGHYQVDLTTSPTDPCRVSDTIYPPPAGQPTFDPTMVTNIQFHVPTNTTAAIAVTDMCVSNLTAIIAQ